MGAVNTEYHAQAHYWQAKTWDNPSYLQYQLPRNPTKHPFISVPKPRS